MNAKSNAPAKERRRAQMLENARIYLERKTLADQKCGDDFFEIAVWQVREMLNAAFDAGHAAAPVK